MEWVEAYAALSPRQREELAEAVHRLLDQTFVLGRGEERREYYLLERHRAVVEGLLGALGFDLVLDPVAGVLGAVSRLGRNRVQLRLMESVLLLLLRLMYEEKRREVTLSEDPVFRVQEIHDRCLALRLRERGVLEKKHLTEAMRLFRRFRLVEVLDRDVTDPECRFVIYPSILYAVRADTVAELAARLDAYAPGGAGEAAPDLDEAAAHADDAAPGAAPGPDAGEEEAAT